MVLALSAVLITGAAGVGAFAGVRQWRIDHPRSPELTPSPTPSAMLHAADLPSRSAGQPAPSTQPTPAMIAAALAKPLASAALGGRVLAEVVDEQSGTVLYQREAGTTAAPASTAKLAVAVATLTVHAATDRITTTVVAGAQPATVVLVGAGDPTLSAAPPGQPSAYPDAARISGLAAQLKAQHRQVNQVIVDDSLFSGPAISPAWQPGDVPSSYASAITAAMADGGRDTPTSTVRSSAPDLAAGDALAADLGLGPSQVRLGVAPAQAPVLAVVRSASYGELVQQMLTESDNVIAECLGRLVAVARNGPASFTGGANAIRAVLAGLGVRLAGAMLDASGLAAADRLAPADLVGVLGLIAGKADPNLHAIVDDLPIAAWQGTLAGRYTSGPSAAGAGLVRAKTGTLTGVSTLAGLVTDGSGRLLAFSFVADQVPPGDAGTVAAEQALDVAASALAACTCK